MKPGDCWHCLPLTILQKGTKKGLQIKTTTLTALQLRSPIKAILNPELQRKPTDENPPLQFANFCAKYLIMY